MNGATMEPGYTLILLQARPAASCHTSNCADSKEELEKAPRIYFHLSELSLSFPRTFLSPKATHSHLSQWRCDA